MARVKVDTVDGPMLQLSVSTKASQSVQDTMLNLQDAFNQEIPSLDFLKGRAEELAQLDVGQDAGWSQRVVDRIDILASQAAAQGNLPQQRALQALLNLPDSNYLKQQLLQQLTQIAQQETSVDGISADQLLDMVASALLHNGVLTGYDRAIPLHEQFNNIEQSLNNTAENVLLADSQVRATYFSALYNTLKNTSQRQVDQMIEQGIPTMQIIKMMENMDVSQNLLNTLQNKAYIAVQLQRKYEQAGLSQPSQNDLNSYVDIVYANLQQDRLSALDVTSSKIDQLVTMLFDGAVLQTNLAQAQLQNDYIQPLIDVLTTEGDIQQQLASAVQIIEALNNNTLQERILSATEMQKISSLIQDKMTAILNSSPEVQVNFLAILVKSQFRYTIFLFINE